MEETVTGNLAWLEHSNVLGNPKSTAEDMDGHSKPKGKGPETFPNKLIGSTENAILYGETATWKGLPSNSDPNANYSIGVEACDKV